MPRLNVPSQPQHSSQLGWESPRMVPPGTHVAQGHCQPPHVTLSKQLTSPLVFPICKEKGIMTFLLPSFHV